VNPGICSGNSAFKAKVEKPLGARTTGEICFEMLERATVKGKIADRFDH
jgi:hypothetical protein